MNGPENTAADAERLRPIFIHTKASPDSTKLAVLRVYPNKCFSDGWERHSDIPSYEGAQSRSPRSLAKRLADIEGVELSIEKAESFSAWPAPPETRQHFKDASVDWIALYEIFSMEGEEPVSLVTIQVHIGWASVELCLRQGLCTDDHEWILPFPLSISPTLDLFTILHKLIVVKPEHYCQQIVSVNWPAGQRWDCWNLCKSIGDKYSTDFRVDTYRYQFYWSKDGRYMVFYDRQLESNAWHLTGTCVAIFAIVTQPDGLKDLRLICSFSSESFSMGIHGCQFHPNGPLLLFRDEKKSYIWNFLEEDEPRALGFDGSNDEFSPRVDQVVFTSCGKFLAVWYRDRTWPELYGFSRFMYKCLRHTPPDEKKRFVFPIVNDDTISGSGNFTARSYARLGRSAPAPRQVLYADPETLLEITLGGRYTSNDLTVSKTRDGKICMTTCKVSPNEVQVCQKIGNQGARALLVMLPPPDIMPRRDIEVQVQAPIPGEDPSLCMVTVNARSPKVFLGRQSAASALSLPVYIKTEVVALRPLLEDELDQGPYQSAEALTLI